MIWCLDNTLDTRLNVPSALQRHLSGTLCQHVFWTVTLWHYLKLDLKLLFSCLFLANWLDLSASASEAIAPRRSINCLVTYMYYYFRPTSTKPQAWKLNKNNDHDGVSHDVECSQEGDRIPPLKSNRQALEQEHRLSCVLRHCSGASTNFLDQLYGRLVPGTGSFNCHWWHKDVRGRQRVILDNLVLCCLVCCWTCFSGSLICVWLSIGVRNCDVPCHGLASCPR